MDGIEFHEYAGSKQERLKAALAKGNDEATAAAFRLLDASGRPFELSRDELKRLAAYLIRQGMEIEAARLRREHGIGEEAEESDAPSPSPGIIPPVGPTAPSPAQASPLQAGHPAIPPAAEPALPGMAPPADEPLSAGGRYYQALSGPVGSTRFRLFMRLLQVLLVLSVIGVLVGLATKDGYRDMEEVHPALLKEPVQKEIKQVLPKAHDVGKLKVILVPLYEYELAGLLVSKQGYGNWIFKGPDDIAPTDLCVIWGKNIESGLFRSPDLEFHQNYRKCYVNRTCGMGFDMEDLSNNHVVADPEVQEQLDALEVGDQIRFKGYLINIRAKESGTASQALGFGSGEFKWNSSTRRTDKGIGACEVIYITSLDVLRAAPRWPHTLYRGSIGLFGVVLLLLLGRAALLPFARDPRPGRRS